MIKTDVVIIGAGASGLMCAATAGYRGRQVLVLDHAPKPGKKILMSGGGRCNFTNQQVAAGNYVSRNPHFCISALKRFTQQHFIELVERHGIDYHQRDHGQLFCDLSSKEILNMLLTECEWAGAQLRLQTHVHHVEQREEGGFLLQTSGAPITCQSLVIATGGLSIPNAGATGFGLQLAEQFGLQRVPVRAGLVPFTLQPNELQLFKPLAGTAVWAEIRYGKATFKENLLFTHRGLSGPAVLQISNYWEPGQSVSINLFPELDLYPWLLEQKAQHPNMALSNLLGKQLSKRLAHTLCELWGYDAPVGQLNNKRLEEIANRFCNWQVKPSGTEGYRTAEVMLGGVDTDELSSKTLEAKRVPGLYFIGEVVDVTGWLGGYNFQWAWSSGFCAGQFV